jgi:repressor LexA
MYLPKLTKRQIEILTLIENSMHSRGCPPTRAEIAREMGFNSANAAEDHLRALQRKGILQLVPGTSRGIRLIKSANQPLHRPQNKLPLVGQVAAGAAILANQNIEDYCSVDPDVFYPQADYLLRVQGNSMRGAGIHDKDLIAVHIANQVQNGQIAVVRLNFDEVTVKRVYKENTQMILRPENPEFEQMVVDLTATSCIIEGLVVGVLRVY